jgi:hypothetical protein
MIRGQVVDQRWWHLRGDNMKISIIIGDMQRKLFDKEDHETVLLCYISRLFQVRVFHVLVVDRSRIATD